MILGDNFEESEDIYWGENLESENEDIYWGDKLESEDIFIGPAMQCW